MAVAFSLLREHLRKLPILERVRNLDYLSAVVRGREDLEFFANHFLGVKFNAFQKRWAKEIQDRLNAGETAEGLVRAGNRTGKTIFIAILMIWFAYYKIGAARGEGYDQFEYNVFDISPKSRQAKQCLNYIEQILEGRFSWVEGERRVSNNKGLRLTNFFDGKNENLGKISFKNGSKAYAVGTGSDQAKSIAGLAGGIIVYDEAPMSHHLRDELVGNIYSRLGDYGRALMLVGTPAEDAKSQQYFYHLIKQAEKGNNDYFVVAGSFRENLFIADKQREQHIKRIESQDKVKALQVLEGAFVVTGGVMLDPAAIENMWLEGSESISPKQGHEYIISVDWGLADQGDETVMIVIDYTMDQWKVVGGYSKRGGDPWELMAKLTSMQIEYNCAKVIMDTASLGGTVFKKMLKDLKPISFNAHADGGKMKKMAQTFMHLSMTKGRNQVQTKDRLVDMNKNFGLIRSIHLPMLEEQLSQYKTDDVDLEQDWVAAFYQGIWWLYKKFYAKKEKKKSFKIHRYRRRGIATPTA